jgi:hypothetical protein
MTQELPGEEWRNIGSRDLFSKQDSGGEFLFPYPAADPKKPKISFQL